MCSCSCEQNHDLSLNLTKVLYLPNPNLTWDSVLRVVLPPSTSTMQLHLVVNVITGIIQKNMLKCICSCSLGTYILGDKVAIHTSDPGTLRMDGVKLELFYISMIMYVIILLYYFKRFFYVIVQKTF